jgi:branched-subunit amino acid transport protein
MSETWIVVIAVGAATIAFKAAGPVLLGGRQLPERVPSLVALLAPVLLTALIVTQTVGGDGELSLDARLPGVAAGAVAVWRRLPIVAAMTIAAAVTAAARLL